MKNKNITLIIIISIFSTSCRIIRTEVPKNLDKPLPFAYENIQLIRDFFINNVKNDSSKHLYILDFKTYKKIIPTNKEYTIVFLASEYCSFSEYFLPKFYHILQEVGPEKFEFLPVFASREKYFPNVVEYLRRINYNKPAFVLDPNIYKTKAFQSPVSSSMKFIKEICPDCNTDKIGAGSFIVFKGEKLITYTTYEQSDSIMIELIKNIQ